MRRDFAPVVKVRNLTIS